MHDDGNTAAGNEPRWPATGAQRSERTPDQLLREAWAIRDLLDSASPDDHASRIRLVAAQDAVRLEAARQWRGHGWRPITDAVHVPASPPSLLVAPALTGLVAALLSVAMLGTAQEVAVALTLVAAAPLVVERIALLREQIRVVAAAGALVLATHVVTGAMPATLVFLPAASLLTAIALVGTERRGDN